MHQSPSPGRRAASEPRIRSEARFTPESGASLRVPPAGPVASRGPLRPAQLACQLSLPQTRLLFRGLRAFTADGKHYE